MGQDIHFYVEQRTADGWRRAEPVRVTHDGRVWCEWCTQAGVLVDDLFHHEENGERACAKDPDRLGMPSRETWLDWRNYLMFTILGSHAGPSRHLDFYDYYSIDEDEVEPVASARGLPVDVSDEVRCIAEVDDLDGHTHSYLTVRELLDYDWDRTTRHVGMVRSPDRDKARDIERGLDQLEGPSLPYAKYRGVVEFDRAEEANGDYQRLTWTEAYWRNLPHQFFRTLLRMARLAGDDLDSVRCVFWFDN